MGAEVASGIARLCSKLRLRALALLLSLPISLYIVHSSAYDRRLHHFICQSSGPCITKAACSLAGKMTPLCHFHFTYHVNQPMHNQGGIPYAVITRSNLPAPTIDLDRHRSVRPSTHQVVHRSPPLGHRQSMSLKLASLGEHFQVPLGSSEVTFMQHGLPKISGCRPTGKYLRQCQRHHSQYVGPLSLGDYS